MNYILIFILFTQFTFSQTEEEIRHDEKIRQEARAQLLKELETEKKANKHSYLDNPTPDQAKQFSKIGLTIEKNLIILDTNKTKNLFQLITNTLTKKVEKMSKELVEGVQDPKKMGVDINKDHINIDINTSKKYLKDLQIKMQSFLKEFDNMAKEFNAPIK